MVGHPAEWLAWFVRLRPGLVYPLLAIAQMGLLLSAVSRGLDYLLPPKTDAKTLTLIEGVAPIWLWGCLFAFFGTLGLIGLHYPATPFNAMGHGWCAVLYGTFGFGSLLHIVVDGPFNDWRTGVGWLGGAVVHWCIANAAWDTWREERGIACDPPR